MAGSAPSRRAPARGSAAPARAPRRLASAAASASAWPRGRARAHSRRRSPCDGQERPVAGLQRQQLAQRAVARAARRARARAARPSAQRQAMSATAGAAPGRAGPRPPPAARAAASSGAAVRGRRGARARRRAWSAQALARGLLDDRGEPVHALIPPVAEQLGVQRADADARRPPLAPRTRPTKSRGVRRAPAPARAAGS